MSQKDLKVAESIARAIRRFETDYFFQFTGGDQGLFLALHDAGIKFVPARSESAAVYMADGYSRISYKPSFVYGQYGPGAANIAAAMADPFWASSPVVAITTSPSNRTRYKYEYQEIDQLKMFDPVTKWNGYLTDPRRGAELVRIATKTALSGSPGPTHLDVPADFLDMDLDIQEDLSRDKIREYPLFRCAPDDSKIIEAVNMLSRAERPVLVAGTGVLLSRACEDLIRLAELEGIPVATSMGGKGSIPETHPLSIGVIGRYSRKSANRIIANADLLVFVGCRLGGLVTNVYAIPKRGTKIIHIDISPNTLENNFRADVPILADAKLALKAIYDACKEGQISRPPDNSWASETRKITSEWRKEFDAITSTTSSVLKPQKVIKCLRELLGENDVVVADTGYMGAWTGALFDVLSAGRNYIRATGSLGWGFPASIGAKLAAPDRNVVCVSGDGGIGYHIMELETALRLHASVVVLVMNNRSLAFEYHDQKYLWGRVLNEVNDFLDVDYGRIASAFGAQGERVEKEGELREALKRAIEAQKPSLVDVIVDKEEYAPTTYYEQVVERKL